MDSMKRNNAFVTFCKLILPPLLVIIPDIAETCFQLCVLRHLMLYQLSERNSDFKH